MKTLMCITLAAIMLFATTPSTMAHPPGCGPWHGGGFYGGPGYYGYGHGPYFWTNFGLECGALALGALVTYLPPERQVVVVNGATYYTAGGVYYQPYSTGYVVVNPPVQQVVVQQPTPVVVQTPTPQVNVVQQPQVLSTPPEASQPSMFYVPNSNGTFVCIPLTKNGSTWIGPQGESYGVFPSVDQLKARYAH